MDTRPEDLVHRYATMSDQDLRELALSYDSLTDPEQAALRAEFARRNLEPPEIDDGPVMVRRKLVTVRRYRDLSEAIVARTLLESAGIPAYLGDENLVRLDWQISNFIGGLRLQVEAADEQAAMELLSQPIPDSIAFDDHAEFVQPHCPHCGSIDISFEGSSRGAAIATLYLFSLPFPPGRKTWVCHVCGARWEATDDTTPGAINLPQ